MATVISFVNQKGGVGKTTSVINVGAALAQTIATEKRILIIDMDPQANSSQIYASISDDDASIYNLLIQYTEINTQAGTNSISSLKQSTYIDKLDILPSNVLLSSAEVDLVHAHGRETILKRILNDHPEFTSRYDMILIDCQPSLGLLTINSMIASDYVVVPLKADVFSLTGLELLTNTVSKLQKVFEIDTTIAGFFFTEANQQESMFKESFKLCKENYGSLLFDTFISNSVAIDHANAMGQSIIDFDSGNSAAQDYINLANELVEKVRR